MKYTFRITETYYNDFEIEADSPEQAEQIANELYMNGELEIEYFFEQNTELIKEA